MWQPPHNSKLTSHPKLQHACASTAVPRDAAASRKPSLSSSSCLLLSMAPRSPGNRRADHDGQEYGSQLDSCFAAQAPIIGTTHTHRPVPPSNGVTRWPSVESGAPFWGSEHPSTLPCPHPTVCMPPRMRSNPIQCDAMGPCDDDRPLLMSFLSL